jgi:hypothetical protein
VFVDVTLILWETALVDHEFPDACEEVKVTDPPEQNVVGPFGVIIGAEGLLCTVTTTGVEVAEQAPPLE